MRIGQRVVLALAAGLIAGCSASKTPKQAESAAQALEIAETLPAGQARFDYLMQQAKAFLAQPDAKSGYQALQLVDKMMDMPESNTPEFEELSKQSVARSLAQ